MHRTVATAALVALIPAAALAEPQRFEFDPSHLSIVFNADHIGYGNTWGMFLRAEGGFMFDEEANMVSDLTATIDAASVFTNDERRDDHLRNDDFLATETHPEITFTMTEAVAETDTTGTITGDLTMLGETRPVTLDVTLNKVGAYPFGDNYVVGVTAKTTIRRSEWGMTYAVENGFVGDEVPIVIELEAIRQDEDPA